MQCAHAPLATFLSAGSIAAGGRSHWCEVARPQVHGHDFSCIAFVPFKATTTDASPGTADGCGNNGSGAHRSLVYVSGSEEKVLRVFEATQVRVLRAFVLGWQSMSVSGAPLLLLMQAERCG